MSTRPVMRLKSWSEDDFWLLVRQNSPEMTRHLGGPETEEKLRDRHRRYLRPGQRDRMFRIVVDGEGSDGEGSAGAVSSVGSAGRDETAGSIGYWEQSWRGGTVWETGWAVLPEFQGRGIAVAAARLVCERAHAEHRHRYVHAFPSVANASSNSLCGRAGFELLGDADMEYPKGHWSRHNDWQFDLRTLDGARDGARD
ncbi:GNAT family N-acetyltransferase [Streptomyces boluensis]|uniref:GNAT family N-acetyltransferase n=1 Tax=Streptomyces boluensis TaxID=1775135 RepID=A0A964XP49_9ACTN|nr:GNAT family N-acetyltransferase [Streptomyces boluensis]NBE56364.1 GNAT family N-acetyltransferase [Streptomyces boluensis]